MQFYTVLFPCVEWVSWYTYESEQVVKLHGGVDMWVCPAFKYDYNLPRLAKFFHVYLHKIRVK